MNYPNITPEQAHDAMQNEGAKYLDVRTVQEFDDGHPNGSVNVPVFFLGVGGRELNPDFVAQVQAVFSADTKLVIGCRSGGRSQTACQLLLDAGYADVANIDGGFLGRYGPDGECLQAGWKECGLP